MPFLNFRSALADSLIHHEHMHSVYLLFLMFASTFKRTHWLVPGYCLGQIFLHEEERREDSPNLGFRDSSHARKELSRSAVPVGMEFHQRWRSTSRFHHLPLEIIVVLNGPIRSCTQILVISWNSVSRKYPPATVILGLVVT